MGGQGNEGGKDMVEILSYPPVLRGFLILMVAGLTFPVTGVYLLRMNLLPLRFMLMHGAILGGAIALSFEFNPFWTTILVNLLLVWFMSHSARSLETDAGFISTFIMVASIGLAFVFIYTFDVPSKDTLGLLWGSLYTLTQVEMWGGITLALVIVALQILRRRQLQAFFFDPSIAFTSGVNESAIYYTVVMLTAFTVALAMRLIGALLLDAIIILPALIAMLHAQSHRHVIIWACVWGGIFSLVGFFLALWIRIPTSSAIALLATSVFLFFYLGSKLRK
jgi:zinc transport system permease protein